MRKFILLLTLILIMLSGCSNNNDVQNDDTNNEATEPTAEIITIELTKEDGSEEISKEDVEYQEGDTVMSVMERNYDIETAYDGTFIQGIDGIAPAEGESYAWMYDVNGEEAMESAADYELSPGDVVHFDYSSWE